MRQVLIYQDEEGGWCAECPSLPGCISEGDSREDAIRNIKEAVELYIDVLLEDGRPVPSDYRHAFLTAV
ncbi:MAG: type II toxin-antitoxin system HicB family antitoxin [Acidobacteriia bacterium]|nr:type II toxin-antitoxin system HicB family antitoxin [Terriglobia bacterium]